jgi:hypothetical protein
MVIHLVILSIIADLDGRLTDEQKNITKDNCFIVSHWQCCEKPAYRITSIQDGGWLKLWGRGSWMGEYGGTVSVDKLPKSYPKENLFVCGS